MMAREFLSIAEMDRIADSVARDPYEGYPSREHRLRLGATALYAAENRLYVPDGPWHVQDHENRRGKSSHLLDPEVPSDQHPFLAPELAKRWQNEGYLLDQYNRPIHPHWLQLLGDERIGLPTGLGFFWRYGPNATVDGIAYRQQHEGAPLEFLLIKRRIGGAWALPGGFVDREDSSFAWAARREVGEETSLDAIGGTDETIVWLRPIGIRDTLHAWTENTAVLLHGNQEYLLDTQPVARDDAIDVGWFTREQIEELEMFDVHLRYIDAALRRLQG